MTKRRVLLIDPPLYKHPLWDPIRTSQPLGIWSIGSYLQACGHDVQLICSPLEGLNVVQRIGGGDATTTLDALLTSRVGLIEGSSAATIVDEWIDRPDLIRVGLPDAEILARIAAFGPDIIGIASLASCMHQSFVAAARAIRSHFPGIPIIAGGQHATAMSFELLRDARGAIDFVVVGEGELVMRDIVSRLDDLQSIRDVAGVAYLADDGTHRANPRPKWTDLAALVPLDPGLMDHVSLPDLPVHTFGRTPVKFTDMMFSVGCHRGCPYCFSPIMRGKLRQQSEDAIAEQLRLLRDAGYGELVLQDDDLLKNRDFFLRLLRLFREYELSWQDNGGMELELLDDELVAAIIESGCTSIYVPINPRQLADRLPTAAAVDNIRHLRTLKDGGVYTFTSGIYGVPNLQEPAATFDDLLRLREFHVRLVAENYVDASLVFPLSALPGTPWFRAVSKNADFEFDREHWIGYSIFVPQIYPAQLGRRRLWEEIIETHKVLNSYQTSFPWFSPFPNQLRPSAEPLLAAAAADFMYV